MENRWEKMSENFDRIKKLGYGVSINWKEKIEIFINLFENTTQYPIPLVILSYDYDNYSIDWWEVNDQVIDIFYAWYYENGIILNNLIKQGVKSDEILESINTYDNVTEMVNREISLQSILSEKKKWDF